MVDPTGAAHPLPNVTMDVDGCYLTSWTATTTDGSGYTLNITATNPSLTGVIYDRAGNKTSWSGNTVTVTDPDGATISNTSNAGVYTYTDSLGTTALSTTYTGSTSDTYYYQDASGQNQTFTVQYSEFTQRTNFNTGCGLVDITGADAHLPTSITTPTGATFSIGYEQTPGYSGSGPYGPYRTGRIASLTLPSGGTISYQYSGGTNGLNCTSGVVPTLKRTVNDNNGNTGTWTYVNSNNSSTAGNFTVTETTPPRPGNSIGDTITHYFAGEYETQRKVTDANSGLLSTTVTCYNGNFTTCPTPTSVPTLPITRQDVYTSFNGSSTASLVESVYDSVYGMPLSVSYFDSVTTPPSAPPAQGSYVLQRAFSYGSWTGAPPCAAIGNYITAAPCYELEQTSSATYKATYFTRDAHGHATTVADWLANSTYLTTVLAYTGGVLTSITEPNGAQTQYSNFACNGQLPQTITYPLPSVGSSSQSWDCNGGVVTSQTDANGAVTNYSYTDPLWRLTGVTPPAGGSAQSITYNTGSALPWTVSSTTVIDGSNTFSTEQVLDGMERSVTSEINSDPAGTDYRTVTYDSMGRVYSTSRPYRATPAYNTILNYDALGRVVKRTNPDGTATNWTYNKRAKKIVDESSKTKVFQYDGEGNLVSVCDVTSINLMAGGIPSACGQDIAATGFGTFYTYDPLGRLTIVNQPGVTNRIFSYDGLSRLLQEVTPEAGTTNYTYDATGQQGDLRTVVHPAMNGAGGTVTATYSFDKMHRVTGISYSDGITPYKGFVYDSSGIWGLTLSNVKGRMAEQYVGSPGVATSGAVFSYDTLGRTIDTDQCTPLLNCGSAYWHLHYAYNNAGDVTSFTNYADGSGITYQYSYDAANHMLGVTSSLVNSTHPSPLWSTSSNNYDASGMLTQATLGNGISRSLSYDHLGRLTGIVDGSAYSFGLNYNGNGTISTANDIQNGNWTYTYDDFNRLSSASETGQAFNYAYDRQGNRWGTVSACNPSTT
ncbi:MAG TPA: hypothetical protein VFA89_18770, partial [Terriglobales bacterium]|nr:hypothetical protein [Terriglobales bacterium]